MIKFHFGLHCLVENLKYWTTTHIKLCAQYVHSYAHIQYTSHWTSLSKRYDITKLDECNFKLHQLHSLDMHTQAHKIQNRLGYIVRLRHGVILDRLSGPRIYLLPLLVHLICFLQTKLFTHPHYHIPRPTSIQWSSNNQENFQFPQNVIAFDLLHSKFIWCGQAIPKIRTRCIWKILPKSLFQAV